jgi:hydroxyacylglutathione hydrolase
MPLTIRQFMCRTDNFGVLAHDAESGITLSVDAPDASVIKNELAAAGWTLTHILVTHHHADHTEGILALKESTSCKVWGPRGDSAKIKGLDIQLDEGTGPRLGAHAVEVIATTGHTLGHICFHLPGERLAFVGDTLFSVGCGRVIEGTPQQMYASLHKLAALPKETAFYCGHEYTAANIPFALTVDSDNAALNERSKEVKALRAAGRPTLPSTIGRELDTNPFLRTGSSLIRTHLGLEKAQDWEVFADLRERKNRF